MEVLTKTRNEVLRKTRNRRIRIMKYVIYRETLVNTSDVFWSFLGSFLAIGVIAYLSNKHFPGMDTIFLIASIGSSAVLVFGEANSPFAQPRNLIGGHLLGALIGVTIQQLISDPELLWLASGLAVALALLVMKMTGTVHPPGGATSLFAVIGSEKVKSLGYLYLISPVLSGVLILLIIALIINNLPEKRQYPYKGKWF